MTAVAAEPARGNTRRALVTLGVNVYDAALNRLRWLWDEFDGNVHVSISGGKDSTVVMELAAMVAAERGQRLSVHFLDQEAEWQATRDYIRHLADDRPDIDLDWYQVPFRLSNNTSYGEEWGQMWDVTLTEEQYVRPREPDSIHDNPFGVDGFYPMLGAINKADGGAHLSGMRGEESPNRRTGLTSGASYKWVTWARNGGAAYTLFHPIYDWSYRDVWKAIHDHGWVYNRIYDQMFTYGVPTSQMRVSSLTHVEAMRSLAYVQEIEPETWLALTRRYPGINAYGHVGQAIQEEFLERRPYMFDTSADYLEYLIVNLIPEPQQQKFRDWKIRLMRNLPWMTEERIDRQVLKAVMRMDYYDSTGLAKFLMVATKQAKKWESIHGEGSLGVREWTCVPMI